MQKEWPVVWETIYLGYNGFSFSRNYPITTHSSPHLPSSSSPSNVLVPTCCSVLTILSLPQCLEAEQQELSSHCAKPSEFPTSPSFTVPLSKSILTTVYQGISVPRARICTGCWQQAAQAFCLLPMKAKTHAARFESKTLDDRYDRSNQLFHYFTLHDVKQLEIVFSHKEGPTGEDDFQAAQNEYSTRECTLGFAESDLHNVVVFHFKAEEKMYIMRALLHI